MCRVWSPMSTERLRPPTGQHWQHYVAEHRLVPLKIAGPTGQAHRQALPAASVEATSGWQPPSQNSNAARPRPFCLRSVQHTVLIWSAYPSSHHVLPSVQMAGASQLPQVTYGNCLASVT